VNAPPADGAPAAQAGRILIIGATGYIGGRLLPLLAAAGRPLRCLCRQPQRLAVRVPPAVEVLAGDVLDAASLDAAMAGVDTVFYLVHSMAAGGDFESLDRRAAEATAAAAARAGVRRIVYLGGLGSDGESLSPHLRSRHEVGARLAASGVGVVELRASIIIGSGSLSFEMIRALVEKLPLMITPRWVRVLAQPIAVGDVLACLQAALKLPAGEPHLILEIGGSEAISYGQLMLEYARQRGLRRWMIPVPWLSPRLSSLWLGLVTPLYARIGRKLVDSLRHPTVVTRDSTRLLLQHPPLTVREAIAVALRHEDADFARTRWSDALSSSGLPPPRGGRRFGNRLIDSRSRRVAASAASTFACIEAIGGDTGWYYADGLWTLRGWLDLLCGGVGMRRGRRDPRNLHSGVPTTKRMMRFGLPMSFHFQGGAIGGFDEEQHLLVELARAFAGEDGHHSGLHHFAVVDFLEGALLQLALEGDGDEVGHQGAVEGGQQGDRHAAADLRRVVEVGQHLDQADQGADHAQRGAEIPYALPHLVIAFLTLFEGLDLLAQAVLDRFRSGAVDQHPEALGHEGILDVGDLLFEGEDAVTAGEDAEFHDLLEGRLHVGRGVDEDLAGHLHEAADLVAAEGHEQRCGGAEEDDDDRLEVPEHFLQVFWLNVTVVVTHRPKEGERTENETEGGSFIHGGLLCWRAPKPGGRRAGRRRSRRRSPRAVPGPSCSSR
jgi:uncharacterized protein YbjT (DUF2867 family)